MVVLKKRGVNLENTLVLQSLRNVVLNVQGKEERVLLIRGVS